MNANSTKGEKRNKEKFRFRDQTDTITNISGEVQDSRSESRSSEVIVFCATFVFFDLVCDLCTGQGVHSAAHRLLHFSGRLS